MVREILGTVGLVLDIVGVSILYVYASTEKIETELSYHLMSEFTTDGEEWLHPYSRQEHKERLEGMRTLVAKNRQRLQSGLMFVIVGFTLQAVALWL